MDIKVNIKKNKIKMNIINLTLDNVSFGPLLPPLLQVFDTGLTAISLLSTAVRVQSCPLAPEMCLHSKIGSAQAPTPWCFLVAHQIRLFSEVWILCSDLVTCIYCLLAEDICKNIFVVNYTLKKPEKSDPEAIAIQI